MAWTTLRDPKTAHSGAYDSEAVARLMRAVARRIPAARDAMLSGGVAVRLVGAILDEDPMAPEIAWTGADGVRITASPEDADLLARVRDAHGLTDPSGRTVAIEHWERSDSAAARDREDAAERLDAPADEALLKAFERA